MTCSRYRQIHGRCSPNTSRAPWHLEVSRVEAFGEPMVHWRKEVMSFLAFALLCQSRARLVVVRNSSWLVGSGDLKGVNGSRFRLQWQLSRALQEEWHL